MRYSIIYDCKNANCRTPIDTGSCSKECIKRYNKEMGKKPKTNTDHIRAMSDEELADSFMNKCLCDFIPNHSQDHCASYGSCKGCILEWLRQPAEK